MKEKLSQSLRILSESVEELSQNLSRYKINLERQDEDKFDFYRMNEEKNQEKIDSLNEILSNEKNKTNRAVKEVRELIVFLKNKMGDFNG